MTEQMSVTTEVKCQVMGVIHSVELKEDGLAVLEGLQPVLIR